MGLTWRDLIATALAGAVAVAALAVTGEWGWAMLGSYRTGSLVVGLLGIGMCITSQAGRAMEAGFADQDRGVKVLAALGGLALVLMLAGIVFGTEALFMALTLDTLGMWLMATIRHATVRSGAGSPARHAPGA